MRLVWKSADADPAMALLGVFTEAIVGERMIHTATMVMGSGQPIGSQVQTHEFSEKSGITTMRHTQACVSKEARDVALASGMEKGIEVGYQRLDALLAHPA